MNTYMLTLKGGFDNWSQRSENERTQVMAHFANWAKKLSDEGRYQECVRSGQENRRVMRKNGGIVVDGPFPETKELISGVFFINARDIADASEVAKTCPVLEYGGSVDVFSLTENRST